MSESKCACERCARPLPLAAPGALTCSYHCTFCSECDSELFHGICPNCGGELLPRPRRCTIDRAAAGRPTEPFVEPSTRAAGYSLTITRVRDDAAGLRAASALFDAYRQFYGQPSAPDTAESFLQDRLGKNESVLLLAQREQRAVGFCQLYPLYSSVRLCRSFLLNDLFVVPAARRAGVGRTLLQSAAQHAREHGAGSMSLATALSNLPAQRLYQRLGWQLDREFLHYDLALASTPATARELQLTPDPLPLHDNKETP